jgi:basic amino acid/polyamine antiporter, APA family
VSGSTGTAWADQAFPRSAGGTVALGFGSYLAALLRGMPERSAGVVAAVALTAANYFGIKKGREAEHPRRLISLSVLVLFVVTGLPAIDRSNLRPFAPTGVSGMFEAAGLLFFAYTGYARVAILGEEVQDPKKTIPKAIVSALAISSLLYLAMSYVAVGTIGAEEMGRSRSPLQQAARTFTVAGMSTVVGIGATTAMLGVLLSQLFAIRRMLFAMARKGDLPRRLGRVHARYGVPDAAVFAAGIIVVVVTLVGSLQWVVSAATFTILIYYTITNLPALRMPAEEKQYPDWIPAFGLTSCIVLAASLPPAAIASGLGLLIVGFGLRATFHHRRRARQRPIAGDAGDPGDRAGAAAAPRRRSTTGRRCCIETSRRRAASADPVYAIRTRYGVFYTVWRFWRFFFSRNLRWLNNTRKNDSRRLHIIKSFKSAS